jgi:Glycosyl transferase family 90
MMNKTKKSTLLPSSRKASRGKGAVGPQRIVAKYVSVLYALISFTTLVSLIESFRIATMGNFGSSRLLQQFLYTSSHKSTQNNLRKALLVNESTSNNHIIANVTVLGKDDMNHDDTYNDEIVLSSIKDYAKQYLSDWRRQDISNLEFAYADVEEMLNRSNRFPSVEQRVKVYMSNWYIPPCDDTARIGYEYSFANEGRNGENVNFVDNNETLTTSVGRTLTMREIDSQQLMLVNASSASDEQLQRFFQVKNEDVTYDEVNFMDRRAFSECVHQYCVDMMTFLLPSMDRVLNNNAGIMTDSHDMVPILYQFGDQHTAILTMVTGDRKLQAKSWYPRIPVIQKMRQSIRPVDMQHITDESQIQCYKNGERLAPLKEGKIDEKKKSELLQFEPIIMKLKTKRHFRPIFSIQEADRVPWEEKKNMGVFRGILSGFYRSSRKPKQELTERERCRLLDRCWFAYTHASSELIDAKLAEPIDEVRMIPRYIDRRETEGSHNNSNKIDLFGDKKKIDELLQYKALIMLEGNDISSGLKWALFSNSVVMMPEPQMTSWAMEEMLVPWVHYIPINVYKDNDDTAENLRTDAEEKMQWVIDNDEKAKEIAKAGKLWIADLFIHPDAKNDEIQILDEIARRYVSHFVPVKNVL